MIEFLLLPAIACVALVGIHAYFGLHVLRRNVIFVDLALAQVAALGATVAFMAGHAPQSLPAYGYALGFTLAAAAVLASTRGWAERVPQEAQIGVIYVVAAAAALLLVDRAPQGAEHIRQILTGNILTVGWDELRWCLPMYLLVGVAHPYLRLRDGWLADFAFYGAFGLVVTSSVALAGVLLVFAFLIIPAAIGALFATTFARQLALAWVVGSGVAIAALAISYALDLSTGATLVCAYGAALALAGIARNRTRLVAVTRWGLAAVLAASAAWIAAFPRADQPLLDALERAMPGLRSAYMDAKAIGIAVDAERYAQRYRDESARLRAREAERRWKGESLDEVEVRRVSAFLKSYNEMINGETFVVREVRARAREAHRMTIAAPLLLAALALAGLPGMRRRRQTVAPQPRGILPMD
ncbi:MAG: metal ABC transporter permease [Usitatibacter sp.]